MFKAVKYCWSLTLNLLLKAVISVYSSLFMVHDQSQGQDLCLVFTLCACVFCTCTRGQQTVVEEIN